MYTGQRTIRYLYNFKNNYTEYNKGDKVSIKTKNNKAISGEIFDIGTKFLYLQIGAELRFMPRLDGKFSKTPTKKILIEDILNIARYPKNSQRYGIITLK